MKTSHSVIEVYFHLVLVTKYRSKYHFFNWYDFAKAVEIASKGSLRIIELKCTSDHVHILLDMRNTTVDISDFVCKLKSVSSGYFKRENPDSWIGWKTGYYLCSVGSKTVDSVKKYISNQ